MSMAPPAPEMAVLGKMSGEYRITGGGAITTRLIFGGTVPEWHVRFENLEYFTYTSWSPADNCYNWIFVVPGFPKLQLRQLDDRTFVLGGTIVNAVFARVGITTDAQGSIEQAVADILDGVGEAQRSSFRFRKIR